MVKKGDGKDAKADAPKGKPADGKKKGVYRCDAMG